MIGLSAVNAGPGLLGTLADSLPARAALAVGDVAEVVRAGAAGNAVRATGSMAEGVYVATVLGSDYGERTAASQAANPKVVILEEITPDGPQEAIVGCAAGHSIYVEYGTSRHAASPFLTPAAEAARGALAEAVRVRVESVAP